MRHLKTATLLIVLLTLRMAAYSTELYDKLIALNGVVSVEQLDRGFFDERYVVMFEQMLDPRNPARGKFEQRVIIGHVAEDRPTVLVAEGHDANRALNAHYREELSSRLGANQIFVEHRYFGESIPGAGSSRAASWDYLTAENAAADLHRIRQALGSIYTSKWIACGANKGGQNAMVYAMLYPTDVDATVAYVAPICFGIEDPRFDTFLARIGTPTQRSAIGEFQSEVLRRREYLVPMFAEYCTSQGLVFNLPADEIFDYCVLEYNFSMWESGTAVSLIPSSDSPHQELLDHLLDIVNPSYFTVTRNPAFFVQASRELGYYGYDTAPLAGLLSIKSSKGYLAKMLLPAGAQKIRYNDALDRKMMAYYKANDPRLICIYGSTDPWTAVAADSTLFDGKQNMKLIVEQGGNHKTRIKTQSDAVQHGFWKTVEGWIFGI